ncbi:MAG TPA: ATP-binding protein [Candidatus Acidoferrum sp.]|nr:ATP-binding protein [Candidatus Acidoferrum sp.]
MSLIKFQNIMSNEISKRSFFSRPPEPPASVLISDPMQAIYIGNTNIFKVPFNWSFINLANPHIAVVGITGSGKSFFVKTFLRRANYIWNTNAVILDWAGEYKNWVRQTRGKVVSLARGDYLNILDLSGMTPLDRSKQIINAFEILTDISIYPEQKRLTEEAIEQAYGNAGFVLFEVAPLERQSPTLKDVIALLQEKMQEGTYEYPAELENAIYRLRQFAREGEDYFARKSTLDLGMLAKSGLVDIDLSGLPDDKFRALAALFILQTIKEKMRSEGWIENKGLKALIVLDEAWKVASDDKSDAVTIVREARKYGFGLIVASQSPTDVNEAIFSNVGTVFIFRIKYEKFMDYLQGSLKFSNFIREDIGRFGVGQAAVKMEFTTALNFPETFILDQINGEEPLYVYKLDMSDVLTQTEIASKLVQKDYELEREELRNKLIEHGLGGEIAKEVFLAFDANQRSMRMLNFIRLLKSEGITNTEIVPFLKSLRIDEALITRILSYTDNYAQV